MSEANEVVALHSGGLKSTVLLYLLKHKGVRLRPLAIDFGQRRVNGLASARSFCERLGLALEVADLSKVVHLLADSTPDGGPAGAPDLDLIMLAVAAGHAARTGAGSVAYGAHDGAGRDRARSVFGSAMDTVLQVAGQSAVRLWRPFFGSDAARIVALGDEFGVPLHLTWSCLGAGELHCGECAACAERREAFREAAVDDLTRYAPAEVVAGPWDGRPVEESRGVVLPDGSRAADSKDAPRLVDVERISRVESRLVAEGKLAPVQ